MHPFKSLVIVRHPPEKVWAAIQEHVTEIAPLMSDVESVRVLERHDESGGGVRFVNRWQLRWKLPDVARRVIAPEQFGWLDYAQWNPAERVCNWRIEPFFHPESVHCSGSTRYQAAIGGRGTRITFRGEVDIDIARLAGLSQSVSGPLGRVVENVVTTMVPRNFRKVFEAAGAWLDAREES